MGYRAAGTKRGRYVLLALAISSIFCVTANAAVTVLGTQYQQDIIYNEFNCIYDNATNYPTSCPVPVPGTNVHVYLKNTGGSSVTVSDITLAGYSLNTVIKQKIQGQNDAYSIYYYWDYPPSDIINAGEPVWFRTVPNPIPAGGVAQAVIRLRYVPTTSSVSIGVVHNEGTTTASVTKDATGPRIASVAFAPDRSYAYIHWRRDGGAAPTTIKVDGVDVTAECTTVSDANYNFAVTQYTPGSALGNMSYHVYQGIYSDGKIASISAFTFVNVFSYGTYGAGPTTTQQDGRDWIDNCRNRGVNLLIYNMGSDGLVALLNTQAGQEYAASRGYGFMIDYPSKWNVSSPRFWYGRDEPDAHDYALECGTGLRLPCPKSSHHTGVLAMTDIKVFDQRRVNHPTVPSVFNVDSTNAPYNYYTYGQASDVGMSDPYYQARQRNAYYFNTQKIPLWEKAELYIYGTTKVHVTACEPNPVLMVLCSASYGVGTEQVWPYATPETKRTEAHYAIAGGAKSMAYWWFLMDTGLGTYTTEALALWKEIGLLGNEFRAAQPIIVTSHPVEMPLTGSTNVWARALASGLDTIMVVVVNDDHYTDINGCHYNPLSNATVTATLPPWMTSTTPYAFEIAPEGVTSLSSSLNGDDLTVQLGTVDLTRLVIITKNANLQSEITQRYMDTCWQGVCTFAPDRCFRPGFTQQPSSVSVPTGGTAIFSVSTLGLNVSYQWQKDGVNLSNGGHYSGVTTTSLTVTGSDTNDEGDYRCLLSNAYYNDIASDVATLTVSCSANPGLTNGNFDANTASWTVADNWTSYSNGTAVFAKNTSIYRSSPNAQRMQPPGSGSPAYAGVLQNIEGSQGDAVTVVAWAYNESPSTYITTSLGLQVDGSTTRPGSWQTNSNKQTWTSLTVSGNATSNNGVTVFCEANRGSAGTYSADFDDVVAYHAFVPPPPTLTDGTTSTSIKVDVEPGCNYNNSSAQYAISIGGGAYTLGTHWVQANGTISTSAVWQTDATWGDKTVTGLTSNTTYTFKVKGRYNGTYTQATDFSVGAEGTPHTIIVITQQPVASNICPGQNTSFSVSATGEGSLSYQWQKDGANLSNGGHYSGCTTATLSINGADANDAASYRCKVTDVGGSVFSEEAPLLVKAATVISSHPSAQNVCMGDDVELYVVATGEGTLAYQWQKNSVNISDGGHYSGCTTSVLAINGVDSNDAANYRCIVTGDCGNPVNSNQAAVAVIATTGITGQPSAQNACPGGTAQFTVTASGSGLTYQWQKNGSNLSNGGHYSGCTTATLTVSGADTNDVADYRCAVSGDCGDPVNSNQAALTLKAATSITGQPSAQNICPNGTAQFTVTATGDGALSYQWQKNSVNLSNGGHYSGCTTATLTVSSADTNDAANYRCVVTGGCGGATSNQAALTLKSVTTITGHPSAQNVCAGSNVNFTVTGSGSGTLSYQWQKNSVNLSNGGHYSGCTTATLTISDADTNDAANYRCVVTGDCGNATSNQAALTVKADTAISLQPLDQRAVYGGTANFSVIASGDGSLSYQWQKNGANLSNGGHYSGCTTATLTISNADTNDEAYYRCIVTGGCGSEYSDQAALTIIFCGLTGVQNGNFDASTTTWTVAGSWTSYSSGSSAFSKNTSIYRSAPNAQRLRPPTSGTGAYCGVYQNVEANLGDAITFVAWAYNESPSQYITSSLGAQFDGSTTPPDSWQTNSNKQSWTSLTVAGKATDLTNGVTMFLHTVRGMTGTYYVDFDDVVQYHAYVTPAPAVTWASSSSLNVNVDPGCNSGNGNAQYAITVGGGGYTLGTHWVQANGTVSTSPVWQTDATWGTKAVTGLSNGTTYTFQVKARYNGTYTEETDLGGSAQGTP